MPGSDAPPRTSALRQDVERRLAELDDALSTLADGLEGDVAAPPPAAASRLAERAAATSTSAQFLQVVESSTSG